MKPMFFLVGVTVSSLFILNNANATRSKQVPAFSNFSGIPLKTEMRSKKKDVPAPKGYVWVRLNGNLCILSKDSSLLKFGSHQSLEHLNEKAGETANTPIAFDVSLNFSYLPDLLRENEEISPELVETVNSLLRDGQVRVPEQDIRPFEVISENLGIPLRQVSSLYPHGTKKSKFRLISSLDPSLDTLERDIELLSVED